MALPILHYPLFTMLLALAATGTALAMHGDEMHTEPGPKTEGKHSVTALDDPDLDWAHCGGDDPEFLKGCTLVPLHTEPETGSLQFFVRTPAGFDWPNHWHTNAEFLLGLKGTTVIEFSDGETAEIGPGVFIAMEPQLVHSAWCTDDAQCEFYLAYLGGKVIFDFNVIE